jgi:pilus assembly protein Flp/PilA
MREFLKSYLEDRTGATAIEYGLIAALIAVVIVPSLLLFTDQFKAVYDLVTTTLGGTP